jgi:hypothetical protein
MNEILKSAFENEIEIGKTLFLRKDFEKAFYHFERAHILGQKFVITHTKSHIWMLRIGIKTKNVKEIIGQLIRIPAGMIGSFIGKVPIGNTGGSNVSLIDEIEIPPDLLEVIKGKS